MTSLCSNNLISYEIDDIIKNNKFKHNIEMVECLENEELIYVVTLKFDTNILKIISDFKYFCDIKEIVSNIKINDLNNKIIYYTSDKSILSILKTIDTFTHVNINFNSSYSDKYHFFNTIQTKIKYNLDTELVKLKSKNISYGKVQIPKDLLLNQNQIFSLLLNEIDKINTNYDYEHYIYPFENNIYDLRFRFTSKILNDYFEIQLLIDSKLYPFFPPKIDIIHPKIKAPLYMGIVNLNVFKLENWNSTIPLEWLGINIFKLVEPLIPKWLETKETNQVDKILTKISILTKQPLSDELNLSLNVPKFNKDNKEKDKNAYWKSGTGYGHSGNDNWDIKTFIKEKEHTQNELSVCLEELNQNISKETINDIKESFVLKYIESTIDGINLLSLQDNKIIIDKVLEILITLYSFKNLITSEFYVNVYKKMININDEILSIFQSNVETQNDATYQSINCIFNMYHQYIIENDLIKKQITNLINNSNSSNKENYEIIMAKQQFDFGELNPSHKFSSEINSKIDNKSLMRIVSEISSFKSGLPLNWESTIWMRVPKNKMNLFTFIISGPKDTPYENGLFEFHACFPSDYPNKEPKVLLVTTGFGKVRFNPNLYNCGKVCLSLLGTWSGEQGEKWNPKTSTFLQVLISIQSLILVEQPFFNEPGYERDMHNAKGKQRSAEYNEVIQLGTMEWAINHQINNPPLGYEIVTKEHFKRKKDDIIKLCETWISKADKLKEQMTNVFTNIKKSLDSLDAK
jgi:ubiquitin-protein ligase